MVILHIAHIETATVGGVNIAVPNMVNTQKEFANVGIINLTGEAISSVPTFSPEDFWNKKLPTAFQKPDFVIFHEVYRPAFLKLARYFLANKIPYLVIPHGCLSKTAQQKKFLKKWIANLLLFRSFLKNAIRIQYLSQREQEHSAFPYPYLILPNGISLPMEEKTAPLSETVKLLYIGRLEWHIKGFDLMLGALNLQKDLMRKTATTLIIHGPNDDASREELQKMIDRYDISDFVTLSGEVWGEDKKNAFHTSHYFIQTSRSEGMPIGLLEAMAHGLPVIVTEGTGFAEAVAAADCGFGCKTSVKDIALAIEKAIYSKKAYSHLSENARAFIQKNYEEKTVAKQTVSAYRALLR